MVVVDVQWLQCSGDSSIDSGSSHSVLSNSGDNDNVLMLAVLVAHG